MSKLAVIRTGGKQYLVRENDEIYVDKIAGDPKEVDLETLAVFDDASDDMDLGMPTVKTSIKAQVIENVKGDKVRIAKFKAKVRYRKVTGFRAELTKLKILSI
jgi:large subunit ribosomal protein L21